MSDMIKLYKDSSTYFQVDEDADITTTGDLSVAGTTTLTGAITATGGVTGDVIGNVTGDVTGDLTGLIKGLPSTTLSVAGPTAVDLSATNVLVLDGGTAAAAATIAAPVAGAFLAVFCSDGTQDCTVTLTAGTFDGTNEIATFEVTGDSLLLYGLSATRFLILNDIGSVALSTAG